MTLSELALFIEGSEAARKPLSPPLQLQQTVAARNQALFNHSSERRPNTAQRAVTPTNCRSVIIAAVVEFTALLR